MEGVVWSGCSGVFVRVMSPSTRPSGGVTVRTPATRRRPGVRSRTNEFQFHLYCSGHSETHWTGKAVHSLLNKLNKVRIPGTLEILCEPEMSKD